MTNYNSCQSVTLAGIDARCDVSFGGIKRILVGIRDEFEVTVGEVSGSTDGVKYITAISGKTAEASFVEFLFRRNTASYTSTSAPDNAIGNSFATTDVNLQFSKAEAKKRMIIQSLINSGDLCLILEDMYGEYLFLGKDNAVVVTNAVQQSGTAQADLNGFTITLQDVSLELPYFIDKESVDVDALIGGNE